MIARIDRMIAKFGAREADRTQLKAPVTAPAVTQAPALPWPQTNLLATTSPPAMSPPTRLLVKSSCASFCTSVLPSQCSFRRLIGVPPSIIRRRNPVTPTSLPFPCRQVPVLDELRRKIWRLTVRPRIIPVLQLSIDPVSYLSFWKLLPDPNPMEVLLVIMDCIKLLNEIESDLVIPSQGSDKMEIQLPFQPHSGPNEYWTSIQPSFTCSLANTPQTICLHHSTSSYYPLDLS